MRCDQASKIILAVHSKIQFHWNERSVLTLFFHTMNAGTTNCTDRWWYNGDNLNKIVIYFYHFSSISPHPGVLPTSTWLWWYTWSVLIGFLERSPEGALANPREPLHVMNEFLVASPLFWCAACQASDPCISGYWCHSLNVPRTMSGRRLREAVKSVSCWGGRFLRRLWIWNFTFLDPSVFSLVPFPAGVLGLISYGALLLTLA